MRFKIVLEKDEDGWFVATCPSLPGCISQGKSEREATKNMKEAIALHVNSLAEDGLALKAPKNRKAKLVSVAV
jgi:predicted RNase H-like HicB family nuclease